MENGLEKLCSKRKDGRMEQIGLKMKNDWRDPQN